MKAILRILLLSLCLSLCIDSYTIKPWAFHGLEVRSLWITIIEMDPECMLTESNLKTTNVDELDWGEDDSGTQENGITYGW